MQRGVGGRRERRMKVLVLILISNLKTRFNLANHKGGRATRALAHASQIHNGKRVGEECFNTCVAREENKLAGKTSKTRGRL